MAQRSAKGWRDVHPLLSKLRTRVCHRVGGPGRPNDEGKANLQTSAPHRSAVSRQRHSTCAQVALPGHHPSHIAWRLG
ncbi:hypothetical protein VTN02DRAFT_3642 [Thermoascus thermophilus]